MTLPRILICVGVTGSGKSYASNVRVYDELCRLPAGRSALITGNTSGSVYKNVVKEIMQLDAGVGFLSYAEHQGRITTAGRAEAYVIGINNDGADRRIQGGSVDLWYADEPTTYPRSAWDMCLSRCRGVGSDGLLRVTPVLCTLNPDSETHWLKTDYVDRAAEVGAQVLVFGFDDNPTTSDSYIRELSSGFSGVFHERMILGKWVSGGEDKIIPEFDSGKENELVIDDPRPSHFQWYAAMDPGGVDFTGYLCGLWDFNRARLVVVGEVLIRDNSAGIAEKILACEKMCFGCLEPRKRVSDTSIQLIRDMRELHGINFVPTMKDDKEAAINAVRVAFQNNRIIIHPRCKSLIHQLRVGRWNKNRTSYERTEADGHYDLIDALVYLWRSIDQSSNPFPTFSGRVIDNNTFLVNPNRKSKEMARVFLGAGAELV